MQIVIEVWSYDFIYPWAEGSTSTFLVSKNDELVVESATCDGLYHGVELKWCNVLFIAFIRHRIATRRKGYLVDFNRSSEDYVCQLICIISDFSWKDKHQFRCDQEYFLLVSIFYYLNLMYFRVSTAAYQVALSIHKVRILICRICCRHINELNVNVFIGRSLLYGSENDDMVIRIMGDRINSFYLTVSPDILNSWIVWIHWVDLRHVKIAITVTRRESRV